jgi:hypothetical protein
VHLDPVLLEHVVEVAPDLAAELALERDLLLHDDRALQAVGGCERRGDLAADVAAADHHGPLERLGVGADRVRVAKRAQVVDALELVALDLEAPHVRAGRDQRLVELDLVLGRQLRHALVGVELHHGRAGHQLDLLLLPPLVRAEQDLLARLFALEVALGQRRSVVRRVELASHEQYGAVGALLAQPARAVGGRQAATDDQVIYLAAGH